MESSFPGRTSFTHVHITYTHVHSPYIGQEPTLEVLMTISSWNREDSLPPFPSLVRDLISYWVEWGIWLSMMRKGSLNMLAIGSWRMMGRKMLSMIWGVWLSTMEGSFTLATIAHITNTHVHSLYRVYELEVFRPGKGTYFEGGACYMVMDAMACTMNISFKYCVNSMKNLPVSVINPTYRFCGVYMYLDVVQYQNKLSYHCSSVNTNPSWGVRMKPYLTPFKCRN